MSGENDFTGQHIVGKRFVVGADGVLREVPTLLTPVPPVGVGGNPEFPFTIATTDWRIEALEADNKRLEAELKATKLMQELDALRKLDVALRIWLADHSDNGDVDILTVFDAISDVNEARGVR